MRRDRIAAFCDWLDTVPPEPPFYQQPGFDDFADLTDGEMMAAQHELRRRAASDLAEAAALAPKPKLVWSADDDNRKDNHDF